MCKDPCNIEIYEGDLCCASNFVGPQAIFCDIYRQLNLVIGYGSLQDLLNLLCET